MSSTNRGRLVRDVIVRRGDEALHGFFEPLDRTLKLLAGIAFAVSRAVVAVAAHEFTFEYSFADKSRAPAGRFIVEDRFQRLDPFAHPFGADRQQFQQLPLFG